MRTTIAKLSLAIGLAVAPGLFAQGPGGPPNPANFVQHRVKMLTTVLSLSSAQQQQATAIFTAAGTSQEALHASMRSAHQALEAAVQNNDSSAIDQAAGTIGAVTGQVAAIEAKANAAFYQILTADQQSKFGQLEAEGPGRMFGPGPPHPGL